MTLASLPFGTAQRRDLAVRDDKGERLWTIQKERPDSPHKIDAAVAAILSWEARTGAIAATPKTRHIGVEEWASTPSLIEGMK